MQWKFLFFTLLSAVGYYHLFTNDEHRATLLRILTGDFSLFFGGSNREEKFAGKLFTEEELSRYDNLRNGLYLGIVGNVFDVSKGAKHYGPGETYHGFIGRDVTMAFVTGEFNEKSLTDEIDSLTNSQTKSVYTWIRFYNENYVYRGKLIGRYYDKDGNPTAAYQKFENKVKKAQEEDSKEEKKKRMFPPCNVEWKADVGTRVWCTAQSGGVSRDWVGVPRQYFEHPGGQYRCACVNLHSKDYRDNIASVREYDECLEESTECTFILTND